MTRSALSLTAMFLLGAAHTQAQTPSVSSLAWMTGCWRASGADLVVEENWTDANGGIMLGTSRTIRNGVATGFEFVLLSEEDGDLVYTAHPSGQSAARFTAPTATSDSVSFTNPLHDFPQRIDYSRIETDSLVANVYAEVEANTPAFTLRYTRVACPNSQH